MTSGALRARIDRAATPVRILAVAWLGAVLYGYPGFLTLEAIDEMIDSRSGGFTDWHSPVQTEIWRALECVVSGPAGMWTVQVLLLLLGTYHLLRRAMPPRPAAIAAGVVTWFPPVLAMTSVVSPDALLAGLVVAGAAALASPRRAIQLAGLGLLLLACGVREGGALAVLPIVAASFTWRPGFTGWRRALTAVAVWGLLVAGAAGLRAALVDDPSGRRTLALASHDIAGVLRFAHPADRAALARELAGAPLAATADPAEIKRWYAHPGELTAGDHPLFAPPDSRAAVDQIVAARDALVRAHPVAYVRQRWVVLEHLIGLKRVRPRPVVHTEFIDPDPPSRVAQFRASHSAVQALGVRAMQVLDRTFVFRPMWYLLAALIALPAALIRRRRDAAVLLASALGHTLGLMFVAIDPERDAAHWLITATVLALVLLAGPEISARLARPTAPEASPPAATPARPRSAGSPARASDR